MANIVNDGLEDSVVDTTYYLFRPDTIIKTIGELTFIYNPILNEWSKTKPISSYIKSEIPFKILDEETFKQILEEFDGEIILKKEITNADIEQLILGKKKLKISEDGNHIDLLPEAFEDKNIDGINILNKTIDVKKMKILILLLIIMLLGTLMIFMLKDTKEDSSNSCEPFLKTINYNIGDELIEDVSYYSSCGDNSFKSLDFKKVNLKKEGIYLYTGIDKNGVEKTGTIIVK